MNRKKLTRRDFLRFSAVAAGAGLIAACQPQPTPATPVVKEVEVTRVVPQEVTKEVVVKETQVVQQTVQVTQAAEYSLPWKYQSPGNPFGGKPIKLSFWDWHPPRVAMLTRWFAKYTEKNPNVTFEITTVPGDQIATKLLAAIPASQAPDFHYYHGDWGAETWIWGGLLTPFPDDTFPGKAMRDTFSAVDTMAGPGGKIYWIPTGYMSAAVYYNKDIFAKAGVTEDQLPKTWDQLVELAKRVTTYDSAKRVSIAGLDLNAYEGNYQYLAYQKGYWLWDKQYSRPVYNQQPIIDALQWIRDLNHKHNVCEDDFLSWIVAFSSGKAAMVLGWTWFTNWMKTNHPDINFGVSRIPTWTGDFTPTIGWGSCDPQSPVVPATTKEDRKAVCFDVIGTLYSNPEFLIDNALTLSSPPGALQLANHPLVQSDMTIQAVAAQSGWIITGGAGAPTGGDLVTKMLDAVFKVGTPINEAVATLQKDVEKLTQDYVKEKGADIITHWNEHKYIHADLMKEPVPLS